MQHSHTPPQTYWIRTSEVGPSNLCSTNPSSDSDVFSNSRATAQLSLDGSWASSRSEVCTPTSPALGSHVRLFRPPPLHLKPSAYQISSCMFLSLWTWRFRSSKSLEFSWCSNFICVLTGEPNCSELKFWRNLDGYKPANKHFNSMEGAFPQVCHSDIIEDSSVLRGA